MAADLFHWNSSPQLRHLNIAKCKCFTLTWYISEVERLTTICLQIWHCNSTGRRLLLAEEIEMLDVTKTADEEELLELDKILNFDDIFSFFLVLYLNLCFEITKKICLTKDSNFYQKMQKYSTQPTALKMIMSLFL
jgi:hypothetical protein